MNDLTSKNADWHFENYLCKSINARKAELVNATTRAPIDPLYAYALTMASKVGIMGKARCRWCSGFGHSHKRCPTRGRLLAKKIATGKFCREIHDEVCLTLRTVFGMEAQYSDIVYSSRKRLAKATGKRERNGLVISESSTFS